MASKTDYKAIAASKIRDPGGGYRRWLIYGRYKMGKTRFISTAPNVLIIDPENGTREVPVGQAKVWPVSTWADMDDVYNALRTGELVNDSTGKPFEWVGVDNFTRIHNMALRYVMRMGEERDLDRIPGLVQKQDYGKAGELTKGMLFNFHSLPMNVIYTTGDRMDAGGNSDDEDEDATTAEAKYVPDLPKGARASVEGIVDVIGRIYSVKVEGTRNGKTVRGIQRRLWISPSDKYDTGYRSEHVLPDYLKGPTVPRLAALITDGKV